MDKESDVNILKTGTHKRRSEDDFQITPWLHSLMVQASPRPPDPARP